MRLLLYLNVALPVISFRTLIDCMWFDTYCMCYVSLGLQALLLHVDVSCARHLTAIYTVVFVNDMRWIFEKNEKNRAHAIPRRCNVIALSCFKSQSYGRNKYTCVFPFKNTIDQARRGRDRRGQSLTNAGKTQPIVFPSLFQYTFYVQDEKRFVFSFRHITIITLARAKKVREERRPFLLRQS